MLQKFLKFYFATVCVGFHLVFVLINRPSSMDSSPHQRLMPTRSSPVIRHSDHRGMMLELNWDSFLLMACSLAGITVKPTQEGVLLVNLEDE